MARDRRSDGRPQNLRPRDALGRPLPRGAAGIPTTPEDLELGEEDTLVETQRLLDSGRPFHAHEVLEARWRSCPDPERDLWQGLAQAAVGATHLARGNPRGALTLLERASTRLSDHTGPVPSSLDLPRALATLQRWIDALRQPGATAVTGQLKLLRADSGGGIGTGGRHDG